MDKGKTSLQDRQSKVKPKKIAQNAVTHGNQSPASSPASCSSPANDNREEGEANMEASLKIILAEIKDFRQDNKQQLEEIKEEISKTNQRLDEVEERVLNPEERVQSIEEVTEELIKLQAYLVERQEDQEGRSRQNNIRVYSIPEGSENESPMMIEFVGNLLKRGLSLSEDVDLHTERAHRALGLVPKEGAPLRSIIIKFLSYRTKEEILRTAWQKKCFMWKNKQINLDNNYAPSVLKKRQQYMEAKRVLKEKGIRFQTPFPARLRVFYVDGTRTYNTAEEATKEMAEKGLQVTVLKPPETLLERIRRLSWSVSGRQERTQTRRGPTIKDKLQRFSWDPCTEVKIWLSRKRPLKYCLKGVRLDLDIFDLLLLSCF